MPTTVSTISDINPQAGVEPSTDSTAFDTPHYTFSDKIRFFDGKPERIGGISTINFSLSTNNSAVHINGACRSIYSVTINQKPYCFYGSHSYLYSELNGTLTNITPLDQSTNTVVGNVLSTRYGLLANNPITTTNGSFAIQITDPDAGLGLYRVGDTITISGATATGGISAANINGIRTVITEGSATVTVTAGAAATSTATGGGAAVNRASGIVKVAMGVATGKTDGDRVKFFAATAFGGITAPQLNQEFIIRIPVGATTDFYVQSTGMAASSATGGGAAAAFYSQIASGSENESLGQGYGAGLNGKGLYGTALISTNNKVYPRIWFFDRYGDYVLMSPGNGGKLYQWDGNTAIAPTVVTNSPASINYFFVSDSIVVTLGANGVENQIYANDQNSLTTWTASAQNQVYQDSIEGAARFLSHVSVSGINLLFTESQVFTFSYIGLPNVWKIQVLDNNIGIIAPMARCQTGGVAYWMGIDNFYMYRGGYVEIIPANTQPQSTCLKYTFNRILNSQKSKTFCWYNERYSEVCWHYQVGATNPDNITKLNLLDNSWYPDTFDRSAAEYPQISRIYPRMAFVNGAGQVGEYSLVYYHDYPTDVSSIISWTLTSNLMNVGKTETALTSFIPDSIQSGGNVTLTVSTRQWPQSVSTVQTSTYTVTPTTERVPITLNGRYWQYTWAGSTYGQQWSMGHWQQETQPSGNGA